MALELGLRFDDPAHVVVFLNEDGQIQFAPAQPFNGPLDHGAQRELQWYLELYPVQYTTELDDERASEIVERIPNWGEALFNAVFADREAERLFNRFQDSETEGRLLTVSSGHPKVLSQPWELLRDPKGTYLFLERSRVSVRRQLSGTGGGRRPFKAVPKDRLHLLFVVSRPEGTRFIDPRSDPQAVMDAIEAEAPGRVSYEFLRPATITQLIRRLEDRRLPSIDVLHFDGHGFYDQDGELAERAKQAALVPGAGDLLRDSPIAEAQQGYLWFENEDGSGAPIGADALGDLLHREQVGLIVLSACQSAMIGDEDPMGSVAARLIHAGLPSVLAMTHSVLVDTTRALFSHFYRELACGRAIGGALDNARLQLYAQPARGERQRATHRVTLKLQDWFLPALYQAGADTNLLTETTLSVSAPSARTNLRARPESGFHGRRRELWDIERWFVGGTRRVVINGFGGQGKTSLAEEAGRWLSRSGMFLHACFVSYAAFQGSDPVGLSVSALGLLLGRSLLDASSATDALALTPTLVILDSLEALDASALNELTSAAVAWSEVGASRVLITTRSNDLHHVNYPAEESNVCRYLPLKGLDPDDALDWFQALMRLPPEPQVPLPVREPLKRLFATVDFHPLSVGVLARQLKHRRIAELGERLEALLLTEHGDPLLASLNLSLERLDSCSRQFVPRLGVFRGGAIEHLLTKICELNKAQWLLLRRGLEQTGLIQADRLPCSITESDSSSDEDASFLHFHPTLAPALWMKLSADERALLNARHREWYYNLSVFIYDEHTKAAAATREIAWRELPNLFAAVQRSLEARDPWAVSFADNVSEFLGWFDLRRDSAALTERMRMADCEVGSDDWYLAQTARGKYLLKVGRHQEAEMIFTAILGHLGEESSHKRCRTLQHLGRCYFGQYHTARAETMYRQALAEAGRLQDGAPVRKLVGSLHADLGDALMLLQRRKEARAAHEESLENSESLGDYYGVAISFQQLGSIAFLEGEFDEAASRYEKALTFFQYVGDLSAEAAVWYMLGHLWSETHVIDKAEHAMRAAARIFQDIGDCMGMVRCWTGIAQILDQDGRLDEAEAWYTKALDILEAQGGDRALERAVRTNLAALLAERPGRLADAKCQAEHALTIGETLDPTAAEIWKNYALLANIAEEQGDTDAASVYRRRQRATYAQAPIRQTLRAMERFIVGFVLLSGDLSARPAIEQVLEKKSRRGFRRLVAALRRILDGERDENALCASLDRQDAEVVGAIIRGIADPATLAEIDPDRKLANQDRWRAIETLAKQPIPSQYIKFNEKTPDSALPPGDGDRILMPVTIGDRGELTEWEARKSAQVWAKLTQHYPKAIFCLQIVGYDSDPREVWEIEECRQFFCWFARHTGLDNPSVAREWLDRLPDISRGSFVLAACGAFKEAVFKDDTIIVPSIKTTYRMPRPSSIRR
jgi:tetratricopeptide (TPR) repeat protein